MKTLLLQRKSRELLQTLERLETMTGETGLSLARMLAYIGTKHPAPVGFEEMEESLSLAKSQVSRNTRALHKFTAFGDRGLDLVDITFDLHNPRTKLVFLNDRGLLELASALTLA
tara:strand:- start:18618 stop:18962 length:345 start_codon:yes stop_codon:yes gene_type:complete